jgi:hypothetical protein
MDLRQRIRQLSHKEAHVLYHTVHSRDKREVGKLFRTENKPQGESADWTHKYLTSIYEKFLWKELPQDEKRLRLIVEAKPIIVEIVGTNLEILKQFPLDPPDEPLVEEKTRSERIREQAQRINESVAEQKRPKKIEEEEPAVAPVIQDDGVAPVLQKEVDDIPARTVEETQPSPPVGTRRVRPLAFAIPAILCCFGVPILLLLAWRIIQPLIPTPIPPIPATNTATNAATIPASSETPLVSPTEVGVTPLASATPAPLEETPTPKPYYEAGESAILRNGVTISLDPALQEFNGGCISPEVGFVMRLLITNRSGEPFLIRFDPQAFTATDDTGQVYELTGSGINICNAVGPQTYQSKTENALYMRFEGEIPLNATYIEITAEVSGEKFVFRKEL